LLAAALAAPYLLFGLGAAPFDDPGEGMHAEIARELMQSGDAVRLTLNGVRYVDKPPLLYGLLAGAFTIGGPHEGVARVVPALGALLAVAATAALGARLLGTWWGLFAGVALLGSCGFYAYGRYVRAETLFVAALAGGFAFTLSPGSENRRRGVVLGLALFGVAALAKDPLGALLPPLAIALARMAVGRVRPVREWLPWPGVIALAIVGLGWWAAATAATPGFLDYTVIDNHVLNVARERRFPDEDVPLSAVEFLAVAAFGAAPWVVAAIAAVARLVRRRAWRDPEELPWLALAIWAIGVVGFTALSPFRLPHYGLPAYPALALLAARGWRDGGRGLALAHAAIFAAFGLACGVAWAAAGAPLAEVLTSTDVATRKAAAAHSAMLIDPSLFTTILGFAAIVFAAGAVVVGMLAMRRAAHASAAAVALTVLVVLPCVAIGLQAVSAARTVKPIALELARRAAPTDVIAHEGPLENSGALQWYSDLKPVIVDGRRSVLGFAGARPEAADTFWDAARLRAAWTGPRRVWVVTGRAETASVVATLPEARLVLAAGGRRLYVNR
jgi:4-amino-4-deoxy-L-arabinose transferase-like glycosyltransferase